MYTVRLNRNGRIHCFNTDTREGAFIMYEALCAAHPLNDLTLWYGGSLLADPRLAA